jgi:hypothetical protein
LKGIPALPRMWKGRRNSPDLIRFESVYVAKGGKIQDEEGALSLEIDLNHLPKRKRFLA